MHSVCNLNSFLAVRSVSRFGVQIRRVAYAALSADITSCSQGASILHVCCCCVKTGFSVYEPSKAIAMVSTAALDVSVVMYNAQRQAKLHV